MPQVNVTIAGRAYRMACGDGEEPRLEELARLFDGKIDEMRRAFGEIGDMRLHVMAALMLADEMSELKTRLAKLEERLAAADAQTGSADARIDAVEERAAAALLAAAERIQGMARSLAAPPAG